MTTAQRLTEQLRHPALAGRLTFGRRHDVCAPVPAHRAEQVAAAFDATGLFALCKAQGSFVNGDVCDGFLLAELLALWEAAAPLPAVPPVLTETALFASPTCEILRLAGLARRAEVPALPATHEAKRLLFALLTLDAYQKPTARFVALAKAALSGGHPPTARAALALANRLGLCKGL